MTDSGQGLRRFAAKLASLNALDESALGAIRSLPCRVRQVARGTTIVSDGELVVECCVLLQGYACRHKVTKDGGRQIVSFHLSGDILDIQHLFLERADHNVQTISDATLGFVSTAALRAIAHEHSDIAVALWRDSLIDASVFREWVLNVGRRDAKMRIAHMLCEFAVRAERAGLGSQAAFTLPMTQEDIADATGLTAIHVNRMLRSLTEEGAISREGREIRIADWSVMRRTADFSEEYLHLAA
ncbi:Crp/Fnr family transcriptional regulator [Sphingomonas psychrotolerans]|uniref:Crp/Fnr family transcriptional regulator n=1 Tax=Sphingomonas psychrotolerans TaxID=1327635 RepID=A0ABU3N378_9SPHN|nr:Crp/Fnr family transcriptional regulator [Sphingomonas psychrotolerans]MDT8758222.1 Crp/Fnr family transcriptional regulator [Sphingomonas psychrotolerans]